MSEKTKIQSEIQSDLEDQVGLGQISELQQQVVDLQSELEAANGKAAENWDLLLRAKAEIENVRRRSRLDLENAHKYGIEKFADSMLHVYDSLERGIESANNLETGTGSKGDSGVNSLRNGMELTLKLLLDNLEKFGIKILDPQGELFNPAQHEALSIQQNDAVTPNSITAVVQKGFLMHDRVLRHAKVIVAKKT
jgi:molecular chaperone GrpE